MPCPASISARRRQPQVPKPRVPKPRYLDCLAQLPVARPASISARTLYSQRSKEGGKLFDDGRLRGAIDAVHGLLLEVLTLDRLVVALALCGTVPQTALTQRQPQLDLTQRFDLLHHG